MNILGLSAYYHDSAATLVQDGKIVAAAQEERFSRAKHDARFPENAIAYCIAEAGLTLAELDYIVFYDKPFLKFERLLETYLSYAPRGFRSFVAAMPIWLKEKLYLKATLKKELARLGDCTVSHLPPLLFAEHHHSHAASAFFPSPFERAAILCLDGVGEWATTSVWKAQGRSLEPLWEIDFPHSLGLLYSAFTYFTGFRVNSGEYKMMGLAPYGEPRYRNLILDKLIDLKDDGTYRLNMAYFDFATGFTMTKRRFDELFGGRPRKPDSELGQREMDIAASIQVVTEEVVLRIARTIHKETGETKLCMAGGVALNCTANGKLLREGPFEEIWVQPAAGDAGGALGAALLVWHEYLGAERVVCDNDSMQGAYLGPCYTDQTIRETLEQLGACFDILPDQDLVARVAELLADQHVIGWFQGRMEFGPRALGSRSILGDPRSEETQSTINRKIKFRESFRPFAPAVIAPSVSDYFELDQKSPYMLITAPIKQAIRHPVTGEQENVRGIQKLRIRRSHLPAVTHVDYSARVQTVHQESNQRFYKLLKAFEKVTGVPVLVNTSFNIRGEPIVCAPEDAYRCFMGTDMDYLVIENFLLAKREQPNQYSGDSTQQWTRWTRKTASPSGNHEQVTENFLRNFGLMAGCVVPLVFGFLIPWLWNFPTPLWPWAVGLGTIIGGLIYPRSMKPLYKVWIKFGIFAGWINVRLILGAIYFLILVPTGILLRALKEDPLARRLDPSVASYRIASSRSEPKDLERPF